LKEDDVTIGAIVQARMSSRRYPGKVLHEIDGKPVLQYLLERLDQSQSISHVIVATSTDTSDDPVEDFCRTRNISFHRGPLNNVAGRFVEVLDRYPFDGFVRLSADSPLLDQRLVDEAVAWYKKGAYELVTNVFPRTFPKGQSVEVIKGSVFKAYYPSMRTVDELEHVTPYFYNHSHQFTIYNLATDEALGNIQMSVDTPEDMNRFERIIKGMRKPHWSYGYSDLIDIFIRRETESELCHS